MENIQEAFLGSLFWDCITIGILFFIDRQQRKEVHRYLPPFLILCILHAALMILMSCFPYFPSKEITDTVFGILNYVAIYAPFAFLLFFWGYTFMLIKNNHMNLFLCIVAFVFDIYAFIQCVYAIFIHDFVFLDNGS